jgi:SAM-dependent methyltransferase
MAKAGAKTARERNRALFDGLFGGIYGFYIEHEHLSHLIAAIVWGGDVRPFYASMRAIADVPEGGLIVDAPCGAGVAFRGLHPRQRVGYLALDLSPAMLNRARRRAREMNLAQIELVEGDAESIPVETASADLFLSYFGLHCLPGPEAGVAEIARCLKPGGRVVGGMITRGDSIRHRLLVHPGRSGWGPGGTVEDLRSWVTEAGLEDVVVRESGLFAYFQATRAR